MYVVIFVSFVRCNTYDASIHIVWLGMQINGIHFIMFVVQQALKTWGGGGGRGQPRGPGSVPVPVYYNISITCIVVNPTHHPWVSGSNFTGV